MTLDIPSGPSIRILSIGEERRIEVPVDVVVRSAKPFSPCIKLQPGFRVAFRHTAQWSPAGIDLDFRQIVQIGQQIGPILGARHIKNPFEFIVQTVGICPDKDLFEVILTTDLFPFLFRLAQRGQEHAREDGDDGNDDQKLDQRESLQV